MMDVQASSVACSWSLSQGGTAVENQKRSVGERHFRAIADSIPAQIAIMTPTGEVESANRQFLEYIGATLEEVRGWAPGDTVHPDDSPQQIAAWKRSLATGEPVD